VQGAVTARQSRLQLRMRFSTETNGNRAADMLTWMHVEDVCLSLTFR